jgi:hypothetical protein
MKNEIMEWEKVMGRVKFYHVLALGMHTKRKRYALRKDIFFSNNKIIFGRMSLVG